jgi:hypothetical protein
MQRYKTRNGRWALIAPIVAARARDIESPAGYRPGKGGVSTKVMRDWEARMKQSSDFYRTGVH